MLHVRYIYLHLVDVYSKLVGKHSIPIDPIIKSGQILILHQPGFSRNFMDFPSKKATFWGPRSCEVALWNIYLHLA